jgi:hypothetical protein
MKKILLPIFLVLFLSSIPQMGYSKNLKYQESYAVGKTIGCLLSNERVKNTNGIKVNAQRVQNTIEKRKIENRFKLKKVTLFSSVKDEKQLTIRGETVHSDDIGRRIRTRFNTYCSLQNKKTISINQGHCLI